MTKPKYKLVTRIGTSAQLFRGIPFEEITIYKAATGESIDLSELSACKEVLDVLYYAAFNSPGFQNVQWLNDKNEAFHYSAEDYISGAAVYYTVGIETD